LNQHITATPIVTMKIFWMVDGPRRTLGLGWTLRSRRRLVCAQLFWEKLHSGSDCLRVSPYEASWRIRSSSAAGLKELGLQVSFPTEPDADICSFDMGGYHRLKRLGVQVENAIDLSDLLTLSRRRQIPIVLYDTPSESGHFSIILGTSRGMLRLAEGKLLPREELIAAWTAPRILRHAYSPGFEFNEPEALLQSHIIGKFDGSGDSGST
jgi:hypothetical protein